MFQFGIFSENDLSFFAGPNFNFGGRVHTNQHLFLKQDDGNTLTLQDRVTAVGEIVRDELANGATRHHTGDVRWRCAPGCHAAPPAVPRPRSVPRTCSMPPEGSVVSGLGSRPQNEPAWTDLSIGTYNSWIRNGRTGARRSTCRSSATAPAPVDLIRRPPAGEAATSHVGRQRFYNMATLRILLSDTRRGHHRPARRRRRADSPCRCRLDDGSAAEAWPRQDHRRRTAVRGSRRRWPTAARASTRRRNDGYRTIAGTSSIGGYILINRQDRDGNWTDVTKEVLNLGFAAAA